MGGLALTYTVPDPPPPRDIISLQDEEKSPPDQDKFKVFSYNILSAPACTTRLYGHSPTAALEWEHRRATVLEDIRLQNADFVCLQEVDDHTFKEYFCVELAHNGYKGIFWPRTRSRTMGFLESKNVDGCATFYKHRKYMCLDKTLVDFANLAINRPDMSKQADIFNRVMPRDHIGVVTFFENIATGSRLILANTHFFWDPAYSDVKLIQAAMLLGEISRLADKWVNYPPQKDKDKKRIVLADEDNSEVETEVVPGPSKEYLNKTYMPLVICADQNSEINSTVSELFAKGTVSPDIPEFKNRAYGNFTKDGIAHPFSLRSAYTNLDKTPEAVPYTNYTPGFRGVIDHIWYTTNVLENVALLGKVDESYMATVPGFPNYHFPSDHIALMAEFAMKGNKAKKVVTEPDFGPSSRTGDRRRN
jgi:CCR4-NOT transcription complex subunit 6